MVLYEKKHTHISVFLLKCVFGTLSLIQEYIVVVTSPDINVSKSRHLRLHFRFTVRLFNLESSISPHFSNRFIPLPITTTSQCLPDMPSLRLEHGQQMHPRLRARP
jgi:hypothetical protein